MGPLPRGLHQGVESVAKVRVTRTLLHVAVQDQPQRQQINDAISKLSDDHREVILLREVQGLDYKEIAAVVGSSLGTVMSRLHYARKKLQTYLKPESPDHPQT